MKHNQSSQSDEYFRWLVSIILAIWLDNDCKYELCTDYI